MKNFGLGLLTLQSSTTNKLNSDFFSFFAEYFEEKAKSSQIKEIHLYSFGFLEPHFLLKYKELFPKLEKLTIDPKQRFSGRKLTDDYCADDLWEIGQLTDILELLASIKHLQIWKLKLELMEGEPLVSFQGYRDRHDLFGCKDSKC